MALTAKTDQTAPQEERSAMTRLNDSHQQLVVHWIGMGCDVVVCLAKNGKGHSTSSPATPSAVYISYDLGDTFENKTEFFGLGDERGTYASLDQFTFHPTHMDHVVFSDAENKVIFTTRDSGKTFDRIKLPFHPSTISFHDDEPFVFLAHDKINATQQLWLTKDYGQTWRPLQEYVKKFSWSGSTSPGVPSPMPSIVPLDGYRHGNASELLLFVERIEPSGKSTVISSPNMFEESRGKVVWISDVVEFEIMDDFMFAVKDVGDNNADLYVSYKRGPFVKAVFPSELDRQDYHIPDVSEGQIFVVVSHTQTLSNLYTSRDMDEKSIYFSLSLERILSFFPNWSWRNSWLMSVTKEPFADLHKVEGLRGIYIASQVQPHSDSNNIAPEHLLTLITFDRGGEWRPITPPPMDENGAPIRCNASEGCSLHLLQKFSELYPATKSIPILSSKSAPGIIMATGTMGKSLKGHPGVFLSRDGGLTWRQILKDFYFFNFGDHGGVLVAVKYFRNNSKSRELLYSIDEGERFLSHEFHTEELRIYGLMAKPGGDTTVFTMFGSAVDHHQWLIIKVDLRNAFSRNCTSRDYKFWSPRSKNGPRMPCILGRKETYQRRIPHSKCYNGRDYARPVKVETCSCDVEDFECDFGFERSVSERNCIRNRSLDYNPYAIPKECKPGGFYSRTRGYRKIPGDVCESGRERMYLPETLACPVKEKDEFLLVAQRSKITRIDLSDYSTMELPIANLTGVIAIEFDMRNNCVYWADFRQGVISRQCLGSGTSKPEKLFTQNGSKIEGMALDWVSNNLYYVDGMKPGIEVIRTDVRVQGMMRRTILDEKSVIKPRGIAVHPVEGYLFWTDWGQNDPSVSRSNLDGSDIRRLFTKPLVQWPNGITIDYIAERIYWVDARQDYIASSNLDGKQFKKIIQDDESVTHPFAVAIFKDNMYWDDWKQNSTFVADKDHGIDIQPILRNNTGLMDLKVFAHSFQQGTNQCGNSSTNKCTHLCMGAPGNSHTCLCPNNMVMDHGACYCPGKREPDRNGACPPAGQTCAPGSFLCANFQCIPEEWVCNGADDCGDNSDEEGCKKGNCQDDMFRCSDGQCIPAHWKCDKERDCSDEGDEKNCTYSDVSCLPSQFRCENGQCISKQLVCDMEADCLDGSDEEHCTVNETDISCSPDEFRCGRTCVPLDWKCDGDKDCPNMEDEKDCEFATCTSDQFQCNNKKCIPKSWRCDGDLNCEDLSDEMNCTEVASNGSFAAAATTTTTRSPWSTCGPWTFVCGNKECIPYSWKCDNQTDCDDKSDEIGCNYEEGRGGSTTEPHEVSERCPHNEFPCYSGACIPESWTCDGVNDCLDGEDEDGCVKARCNQSQFKCRTDGSCIFFNQVCDGVRNCPDGSDERNCPDTRGTGDPAGPSCSPGFFSCEASRCLPLAQLCDGHEDCYDGTDESNCSEIERVYQVLKMFVFQRKSTSTSLHVFWNAPASQQGIHFLYLPSIAEAESSAWRNATSWIEASEYRFTGLKPFTNYNMTVYVGIANTNKVFPPAEFVTGLTPEGVPTPPRNVSVVQRSYMSVDISWLPPERPNGRIVSYELRVSPPYPPISKTVSGSVTSIAMESDFSRNENYSFWMTAANDKYESNSSEVFTLKFDPSSYIEAVQGLVAEAIDEKSIRLSWKEIANVHGYHVETYLPSNLPYPRIPSVNATKGTNAVTITNLAPNVHYNFKVNAFRSNFIGPSASVKGNIAGASLPAVPIVAGELVKGAGTTVRLAWNEPHYAKKEKWTYGVYYSVRSEELFESAKLTTTNLSVVIPNLAACETYLFDVGLVAPLGIGPLSVPFTLPTMYNRNAPPKRLSVETNPANDLEMIVRWVPSCEIVTEAIGYEITISEENLNKSSSITFLPTKNTEFEHKIKTHYGGRYRVAVATTAAGAIPSAAVLYEAPEILPPHQVRVLPQTNGSSVITWQENKLPKAIQDSRYRYKVLVSEGENLNVSTAREYSADTTQLTLSEIKEGVIYSFAVVLVTEDGYSSRMSEVSSFQTSLVPRDEFFSKTNFVSILVPIMVLLTAVLIVLGCFIYRQKRLKRHFGNYANSHYDTRSGSTTFGGGGGGGGSGSGGGGADDLGGAFIDDEDSPNFRGFSDDEPLVMA